MKKVFSISLALIFLSIFLSCKSNSTGSEDVDEASQERQFVWNSMNYWYFWQEDVPKLANDMQFFDSDQAYHDYLAGFQNSEALFYDLLFSVNNFKGIGKDDFSFFIDDYVEFNERRQGISYNFGFEYGLVRDCETCTDLFGYVQYVLEDTPADDAGLVRGDVFTHINGTRLTVNNYTSVLTGDTYDIGLADYSNQEVTPNGETITVQATNLTENPIYLAKVLDVESTRIGYLLYNSFQSNSHQNMNDVFGDFASQGIDELVLDLRYNGGGSVITSRVLTSMISGLGDSDEFGEYSFNSKRAPQNNTPLSFLSEVPIFNSEGNQTNEITMNTLALDRLYVLTGFGTASASESVINSLKPYMEVIVIGRETVGKDDVSITLYDTGVPYFNPPSDNSTSPTEFALQPIVAKLVNRDGVSNNDGFVPEGDRFIREIEYLDDLPPLGDPSDPLLAKAIQEITGAPIAKSLSVPSHFRGEAFLESSDLDKSGQEMYILPEEAMKLKLNFTPPNK